MFAYALNLINSELLLHWAEVQLNELFAVQSWNGYFMIIEKFKLKPSW